MLPVSGLVVELLVELLDVLDMLPLILLLDVLPLVLVLDVLPLVLLLDVLPPVLVLEVVLMDVELCIGATPRYCAPQTALLPSLEVPTLLFR